MIVMTTKNMMPMLTVANSSKAVLIENEVKPPTVDWHIEVRLC